MKKKVAILIMVIFLSFTFISLANSKVSMLSNNILMKSTSKLSSSENMQTAWTDNGTPISVANSYQDIVAICSDGAGGAIITWQDYRLGNYDIFAQKIHADGSVAWATGGLAICTDVALQWEPQICSDGAGGAIITWADWRSGTHYDTYAQKVNVYGALEWTANGLLVSTAPFSQQDQRIMSDGEGGAIITWDNGSYSFAQRILSNGTLFWTIDGTLLSSSNIYRPEICSDGAGGAIITMDGNIDIHAQRVNSTGHLQWTATGKVVCSAVFNQDLPKIISDGSGGAIITWQDPRSGLHIYAQKINSTGDGQWTTDGVQISTLAVLNEIPKICSDGAGGAIITWKSDFGNITAQRISSAGNVLWTTNGVEICTVSGVQDQHQICSDGAGGAIIVWQDPRGPTDDIYAQKIDASGVTQWTANGSIICNKGGDQQYPQICSDGAGGAIIAWDDERTGINDDDIYAQRVLGSPESPFDWVTLISLAIHGQYGGLMEDISKMIDVFLRTLLSPMVLGIMVLGEALLIIILSSVVARQRKTPVKTKKVKKR